VADVRGLVRVDVGVLDDDALALRGGGAMTLRKCSTVNAPRSKRKLR
jgi:hypothetical protein